MEPDVGAADRIPPMVANNASTPGNTSPLFLSKQQLQSKGKVSGMHSMWVHKINKYMNKKRRKSPAPVAHTYNPSYSGGRDQEDCGSKPALTNSSQNPVSKKKLIMIKKDW
jgi:hypothetical protein